MRVTIITDASWCPDQKVGAFASWIRFEDNQLVQYCTAFKKKARSATEAEYWAVVNSIVIAQKKAKKPLRYLLIQTDCQAVIDEFKGRGAHIQRLLATLGAGLKIEFRHVKGHTKKEGFTGARFYCNRWCHAMAIKKMRTLRAG